MRAFDPEVVCGLRTPRLPLGWAIDGAHRNDVRLLEPTLDTIDQAGSSSSAG